MSPVVFPSFFPRFSHTSLLATPEIAQRFLQATVTGPISMASRFIYFHRLYHTYHLRLSRQGICRRVHDPCREGRGPDIARLPNPLTPLSARARLPGERRHGRRPLRGLNPGAGMVLLWDLGSPPTATNQNFFTAPAPRTTPGCRRPADTPTCPPSLLVQPTARNSVGSRASSVPKSMTWSTPRSGGAIPSTSPASSLSPTERMSRRGP